MEPRKCLSAESLRRCHSGGHVRHTVRARGVGSRRGLRTRQRGSRAPQEPGRPVRLRRVRTSAFAGRPTRMVPGPVPCAWGGRERNGRRGDGTAPANPMSGAGRAAGVGALHSTGEAGEPAPRGPGGGKGAPGRGAAGGRRGGDTGPHHRVHVTPAGSEWGRESATRRAGCLNRGRHETRC
jgi:hypothetical protein